MFSVLAVLLFSLADQSAGYRGAPGHGGRYKPPYHDERGRQCLSSPPEITWYESNAQSHPILTEVYEAWTAFQDCYVKIKANNMWLRTRLFDCSLPSKTIRMARGYEYRLTVYNDLPPETALNSDEHNSYKDPNTVNIHTHGPHISGMAPGDTVFVDIHSGSHNTYVYDIPCDHAGGTFWWHPHHHGSTDLHVAGGAAGFVIIDDDPVMEGLPAWYSGMTTQMLIIQNFNLTRADAIMPDGVDEIFSYGKLNPNGAEPETFFYLINGQYLPTICINSEEWTKLRISHVDPVVFGYFHMQEAGCSFKLLALDGVIVRGLEDSDVPRDVEDGFMLSEAGRADIAVWCPGDASGVKVNALIRVFPFIFGRDFTGGSFETTIAYFEIHGTQTTEPPALTPFTPIRPPYLVNMLGETPSQTLLVNMSDFAINGVRFIDETSYFGEADVGEIIMFDMPSIFHTLHVHVNHMQVDTVISDNVMAGYQARGDWMDSYLGGGTAYYYGDTFGGTVVLHCHILQHEDEGVFTTLLLKGGCAADYYSDNDAFGSCEADYSQCQGYSEPLTYYAETWHSAWHWGEKWGWHSLTHDNWWLWWSPDWDWLPQDAGPYDGGQYQPPGGWWAYAVAPFFGADMDHDMNDMRVETVPDTDSVFHLQFVGGVAIGCLVGILSTVAFCMCVQKNKESQQGFVTVVESTAGVDEEQ